MEYERERRYSVKQRDVLLKERQKGKEDLLREGKTEKEEVVRERNREMEKERRRYIERGKDRKKRQ